MKSIKTLFYIIVFGVLPFSGIGQEKGIQFKDGLRWQEIKAMAKEDNKYIFLDCFASWCGPCKLMDQNVYSIDSVGDYMNSKFISVKVQMDTTKNDQPQNIGWYTDAHEIRNEFHINAFPTFLFFSPSGKCIHMGIGYRDPMSFVELARNALDSQKQCFVLKEKYKRGERDYSTMAYLATTLNSLGDNQLARNIADDYMDHYLFNLKDSFLYTRENIDFISRFVISTSESGFRMFYWHTDKVNEVMNDSMYAQRLVNYLISKAEIDPKVLTAIKKHLRSPNWKITEDALNKKYNQIYAGWAVTEAKVRWYGWKKNWPELTKNTAYLLKKFGPDLSDFDLNNHAWNIFLYSFDRSELETALFWVKPVMRKEPDWPNAIDTYANLLYKLGKYEESLVWENKALKLEQSGDKQIQDNFDKMTKRQPTWLLK